MAKVAAGRILALASGLVLLPGFAAAQEAIFGRDTIHGFAEIGAAAGDGERSWVKGGFGKSQVSGDAHGGWKAHAGLRQAVVEWRPDLGFALGGVVSAQWQPGVHPSLDFNEAYLR